MSGDVTRFINILKKGDLEDFITENEDGTFEATVHTGEKIETFKLKVSFDQDVVTFITEASVCAKEHYENIKNLLDSINDNCKYGSFFINPKNIISFKMRITLDELEQLENPFRVFFCGCMTFEKYQGSILKALIGQIVFYINISIK